MGQKRKKHSDEFKAQIALEAVKGIRTTSEISSSSGVHPNVIGNWKRQLVAGTPAIFSRAAGVSGMSEDEITAPLYEEIGRLKMEVNWLKKKL